MTVPLTPVETALPATVPIPADGELVNSSSVAGYVQTIINVLARLNRFYVGGAVRPTSTLEISPTGTLEFFPSGGSIVASVDTTKVVAINGGALTVSSGVDGGLVAVGGPAGFSVTPGPTTVNDFAAIGATNIATLVQPLGYAGSSAGAGPGYGRAPKRPLLGSNTGTIGAHTTFQAARYDTLVFPIGTLSTTVHWEISNITFPTQHGDSVSLYNGDTGSNSVNLYAPGGIPLGVAPPGKTIWSVNISGTWYYAGGT